MKFAGKKLVLLFLFLTLIGITTIYIFFERKGFAYFVGICNSSQNSVSDIDTLRKFFNDYYEFKPVSLGKNNGNYTGFRRSQSSFDFTTCWVDFDNVTGKIEKMWIAD